jgi:two-component system CheB/CheR fusion protein
VSDIQTSSEDAIPRTQDAADFHVVGIGASAGGLEPLERLFSRLPPDTGMAFVVVQHLSPDFKSLMSELLSRRTPMPVRLAEHEMPVEPNCVYLIPPTKEMTIKQRRLLLHDKDPKHGLALPIDLFLRSLAHDRGERSVAVILSGSGSDGSRGIQDIHRAGGMVLCESPDTAQFNGMPVSAMNTGVVDQILPAEDIADAIAALGRPSVNDERAAAPGAEDSGSDAILRLLRDEYGIDFSHYKASTVTRRIERRLALNRSIDLEMYAEQLRNDPRELNSLYEDLLIGVTRFFRDDAAFAILDSTVIPEIVERTAGDEQIRVWVPGCATGQEPYSIAMLLHEHLAKARRPIHVKILATDVHKTSLEVASAGVYSDAQVAGISTDRLQRFFTRKSDGYHIAQTLRESIVFAPHNLIRDAPFTKLDLVVCRNLLIYFQPHAQQTVLTLFHFCLKPGGFLFLGSSETPGALLDEFDTIDEHSKVYRKRRDIALPRDLRLPLARATAVPRAAMASIARSATIQPQLLAAYDRLLDRFMPPSFLVDMDGALLDSFGGVAPLLKVKQRRPSQLLVDMVDEELKAVISSALHRLRRNPETVIAAEVEVPGQPAPFTVTAEPIRTAQGAASHVLITLEAAGATPPKSLSLAPRPPESHPAPVEPRRDSGVATIHVQTLEEELSYTKQNLQAAIEELEATNEELQATNEELIASNEELQSTNEELHSVNEELYTVNAEYQKKNAELQELNNDIEHLLNGTDVATIFLDRELCIRKFTPRIAETFDLLPQDLGRSIRSFSHDLTHATLTADIERVLHDGSFVETQTWDSRDRCYFLRILPYRARAKDVPSAPAADRHSPPAPPDGVVLTLIDISALEEVRAKLAQLSAIVESSDDAIVGNSLDGVITTWNNGACRLFGYAAEEAVGRHFSFLQQAGGADEIDGMLSQVRHGRPVERLETKCVRKDGTLVDLSIKFSPIFDATSKTVGVSAIARDITPLIRTRFEVAEREERIRLLLDSTAEAIYGIDLNGMCTFCNPTCARVLGYESPSALIGKQMHPLVHHTRADGTPYPAEQSSIYEAMRHRQEAHVDDEVLWRADGTCFPAEYWSHPIYRDGDVLGAVVTFLDITERRRAEQEIQEGSRRREQFLAMLSHELRNPLAAILSATRVLEASVVPDQIRQEAGLVVERQAKHMARLLDDLLDVARITRGRIVLRNERVDLRDTTRSAVEALQPFLAEHDAKLELEMDEEPIPVIGDPTRLQQVQANLLSNAAKYSPRGGTIRLKVTRDGDAALIRVADHGNGIEPEMLPRIFDLFVQGDKSLDRTQSGLGIGLTLLRSLVGLHNGDVDAHSDGPGTGSTFTVRLPLATAGIAAGAAPGNRVRTVVIVEDQADARRMLQILLESMGVRVFTAENGQDGAALIERVQPDLALVDLGLPVMSGYELARLVRKDREGCPVRLVALSGYGQDADVQAAIDAGFDEHITKPPAPERLEQLIGTIGPPISID